MTTFLSRINLVFLRILFLASLSLFFYALPVCSENQPSEIPNVTDELEEELRYLKAETYVITASKVMENIKKAPASITVITDRQIRQMGARGVMDVLLRAAPSFYSHRYYPTNTYFPLIRGGLDILTLINGHPIYDVLWQGRTLEAYDTMNVENIKRIEIIRGPGSALYGANAFNGVINIITKEAEDIDGVELTTRGGSWDTQQYNILFGKTLRDLEMVFNFNYFKTNGYRAFIKEDLWTQFDRAFAPFGIPPASLAPGHTREGDEKYDAALNFKYKGLTFNGRYVDREVSVPLNFDPYLTGDYYRFNKDYYLNLGYQTTIREGIDIYGKIYRHYQELGTGTQPTPTGVFTPILNPVPPPAVIFSQWPEGLLTKWLADGSRTGIELQSTYKIGNSNTIVAGVTYEEQEYADVEWWANYISSGLPDVLIQLPSMQRMPDPNPIIFDRDFKAIFLEHIWGITDDLRLTTGLRYDHYSDFGGHLSPRVGVTWEYIRGYDLKLLYGHAYRAPTPGEMIFKAPGNTLEPETLDTYEISFGADLTSSFNVRLTLYQKDHKNIIEATAAANILWFDNLGSIRSQGVEVEAKYDFGRGNYIFGNYHYRSTDTGVDRYMGKIMANIRLSRYVNVYTDCNHLGGFHREAGDLRDDLSSFTYFNATVIGRKFLKGYEGLELRGSVYNLFDEDYSYYISADVPYGWPQPGISFVFEMKYRF